MKRIPVFSLIFAAGLAGVALSGMAKEEPPAPPKSAASVFDHGKHRVLLEKDGFNCVSCHPFNATLKTQHEKLGDEIEARYLNPGQETCHYCHNNQERKAMKPMKCVSCHKENMAAIIPKTHTLSFKKDHRVRNACFAILSRFAWIATCAGTRCKTGCTTETTSFITRWKPGPTP